MAVSTGIRPVDWRFFNPEEPPKPPLPTKQPIPKKEQVGLRASFRTEKPLAEVIGEQIKQSGRTPINPLPWGEGKTFRNFLEFYASLDISGKDAAMRFVNDPTPSNFVQMVATNPIIGGVSPEVPRVPMSKATKMRFGQPEQPKGAAKPPAAQQGKAVQTKPSFVLDAEGEIAKVVDWKPTGEPVVVYPGKTGGLQANSLERRTYSLSDWKPLPPDGFSGKIRPSKSQRMLDLRKWKDEFISASRTAAQPKIQAIMDNAAKAGRRQVIEARLQRGEPVPEKLLAEFPDLRPFSTVKENLTVEPSLSDLQLKANQDEAVKAGGNIVKQSDTAFTATKADGTSQTFKDSDSALEFVKGEQPFKPVSAGGAGKPPEPPIITQGAAKTAGAIPPPAVSRPASQAAKEGKFWLPEPPRQRQDYIDFARKELPGSFKKKEGALDVVEQARQQVLKARDLGTNTVNYVDSYVRQAGNLSREFGLTPNGMASRVKNPNSRSLAINDVLSNPTHYDLTPAQQEIAKRYGFVYQEALRLARSYGVKINELGGPDEFWQYIARRVKSKVDPQTGRLIEPQAAVGGFKMGAKISAQKQRVFDEMLQGLDAGYLYEHPEQTLAQHIKGIYRLIGNKQAEESVKPLTRLVSRKHPLEFGEQLIYEPAFQKRRTFTTQQGTQVTYTMQRAATQDVARAIDKIFTPEQEMKALRTAADISGAMVGQVAALDISAPFLQGLPVLGHDIKMGLKGRPSAVWLKSYGNMLRAVKNPEAINTFRSSNQDLYKRAMQAGVMIGDSEFVSGVGLTYRTLGKIPQAGGTLKEAYRQVWGRMGQAYSDFLEIARLKLYEQMEPAWLRSGNNIHELGAVINRMTGTTSATARGVGANRRLIERIGAFAPNYLRSSFLLIGDMAGRGAKAREVQSTIATMLGVGFALYYAEEKMRGQEPKLRPWPKRFGGDGAEAFTTEINGQRVGLGSWMYGMLKLLAEVGALAVDDPQQIVRFDANNPFMRFLKTKQGPGLSLATELATGRNFWGQPFDSPDDYLLRIAESFVPITAQSFLEKDTLGRPKTMEGVATTIGVQALGLRSFPYTLKSQWTDAGYFKEYETIPMDDAERKFLGLPYSREQYRESKPDIDARLFITEQASSMQSHAAVSQAATLIREANIDPLAVSGIASRIKERQGTLKFRQGMKITPTDQLIVMLRRSGMIDVPRNESDDEAQMWDDIERASFYYEHADNIKNENARTTVRNYMRATDPGLDVALRLNGFSRTESGATPESDAFYERRREGDIEPLPISSVSSSEVYRVRRMVEEYYNIEDNIWRQYPANLRVLADKMAKLESAGKKGEALAIVRENPTILRVRAIIAQQKARARAMNRELDTILKAFG